MRRMGHREDVMNIEELRAVVRRQQLEIHNLEDRNASLGCSLATSGSVARPSLLTNQQFQIMVFLRSKSPKMVTKVQIEDYIWGLRSYCDLPHSNAVRVQISKIRKLLPNIKIFCQTHKGYCLDSEAAKAWDDLVGA